MRHGGRNARTMALIGAALLGAATRRAGAQPHAAPTGDAGFSYSVEGYVAQYSLDTKVATNVRSIGAFGARVMFIRPDPDRDSRSIIDRAVGGVFATFSPNQGTPALNTLHIGVETDLPFFVRPIGG